MSPRLAHPILRLLALGLPSLAMAATPEPLCPGQTALPGPDGRVLGHIPYRQALDSDLVAAPAWFAAGASCLVHRDVAPDLGRLLSAAAAAPGVGTRLRGISCFRSVERQRAVFCSQIGPGKRCKDAAERARSVGPPGFSEHATGYAIDFGLRPSPNCADVSPCIARTVAGQWLIAHARDYGFELSFPAGNAQGVTWEPWHWRWVGTSVSTPGAVQARLLFKRARADFPANPMIRGLSDEWLRVIQPQTPAPPAVARPQGSPYLQPLPQSYFIQPLPTPTPTPMRDRRGRRIQPDVLSD
ncbi:M15 family metallopeptidase [Sphingomonas immobilis]|uniref:M15 family metallopeptidase n=1 Tax=Sphingomonas immobilis TaxID=3063997 RepID=A0ABT9A3K1_9SPHN|nr:M15 family metallopeptidase [Sphingomonas sp. CA1-15]MDO7844424.1 M15 family metallopeptidase [Sphingomonas sp. CA1-15]